MLRNDFLGEAELLERLAGHDLGGKFGKRDSDRLADEGRRPRGAGIDLEHVDLLVLDCVLDVHEAADVEFEGHGLGGVSDGLQNLGGEGDAWKDAGAVAAVDTGFLDVLHDAADDAVGPVG